ncbi:MAG: hypothetical protein ACI9F9_001365 [Candidatus Paceibacteria bacterium]|jgi:hypothetical protein
MDSFTSPIHPNLLLADSRWMRGLAAQLIRGDASVLDSLVQETWLVALERRILLWVAQSVRANEPGIPLRVVPYPTSQTG